MKCKERGKFLLAIKLKKKLYEINIPNDTDGGISNKLC